LDAQTLYRLTVLWSSQDPALSPRCFSLQMELSLRTTTSCQVNSEAKALALRGFESCLEGLTLSVRRGRTTSTLSLRRSNHPEMWPNFPGVATIRGISLSFRAQHAIATSFLGWVAECEPQIVRDILSAGHEIACHSYLHRVSAHDSKRVRTDTRRALAAIQAGKSVLDNRAPRFYLAQVILGTGNPGRRRIPLRSDLTHSDMSTMLAEAPRFAICP